MLPSERRNHAKRYWKVFLSFLISRHLNIPTSLFHAFKISLPALHSFDAFIPSASSVPHSDSAAVSVLSEVDEGNQTAAGRENTAHQMPLSPMARRNAKVVPWRRVTGMRATRSKRIPAA